MRTIARTGLGVAILFAATSPICAQQTGEPSTFSDVTRTAWYNIRDLIVASATKMPEEHFGFHPTKDVRTFGEILGHLAGEHFAICGGLTGRVPPKVAFEKLKTKAEIRKTLDESIAICDLAYGLMTDQNAAFRYRVFNADYSRLALLMSNITHDSEHYGNLVTYMRLNKIVPPSSAR